MTTAAPAAQWPLTLFGSRRFGNALGFLVCYGMLAFGYYLQFVKGVEPCPLCIIQRLLLAATGLAFLVAAIHHPVGRWAAHTSGAVIAVFALIGVGVAGPPRPGRPHP